MQGCVSFEQIMLMSISKGDVINTTNKTRWFFVTNEKILWKSFSICAPKSVQSTGVGCLKMWQPLLSRISCPSELISTIPFFVSLALKHQPTSMRTWKLFILQTYFNLYGIFEAGYMIFNRPSQHMGFKIDSHDKVFRATLELTPPSDVIRRPLKLRNGMYYPYDWHIG